MDIILDKVSKSYGDNVVLKDFSCIFPEGRTTVIMGKSGCGKTTLLSVCMSLEKPDGGSVEGLSGKKLSAVFQEDRLCEKLSVYRNVRMTSGKGITPEKINSSLCSVGLCDFVNAPVSSLSGGMKRRTAIVRACLADFDVLFLDEPFKGLDEVTKENVMRFVSEASVGKTVIAVTHDESEAKLFGDNLLIM